MNKKEDVEIVISKYGTKLPLVPFSNPQAILVIGKEKQIVSKKDKKQAKNLLEVYHYEWNET